MALLNTADAIYLGDQPVDRVYLGPTLVWQPPLERLIALAGTRGAVWIVGVSPAWQDEDRTVPAGDGDPVRVLEDLSGNDFHWIAPNDPARPALVRDGDYWHLLFDGVDDYMTAPSFGVPSWPHDGSGATLAVAVADLSAPAANQYGLFSSARLTATHTGYRVDSTSGGGALQVSILGGGSNVLDGSAGTIDSVRLIALEHGLSDAVQYRLIVNNVGVAGGNYTAAPSSDPATETPHLFRAVTLNRIMAGHWYGGCMLPVTGQLDLVHQVLTHCMPPIPGPAP